MNTHEFTAAYSVAKRQLTGALAGITLHQCRAPNGRWFGAVEDTAEGWCSVIPMHSQFACDHFWRSADAAMLDELEWGEDEGCPHGDPDCEGGEENNHWACDRPLRTGGQG